MVKISGLSPKLVENIKTYNEAAISLQMFYMQTQIAAL